MSAPASAAPHRLRRFRVDVATIISAMVLIQSLVLVGLGYWGSQRMVSNVGESAHRADHARVEDKVNTFLGKAVSVVEAMGNSPGLRPAGEGSAQTAELLWVLLQQSPELDSVYVANDAGRMLMVQRYPQPAVRQIVRDGEVTVETWSYKPPIDGEGGGDAQARYATQHISAFRSDYNPLARSWFVQATERKGPVWTMPYVFFAAQELGVTFAQPAKRRDGEGQVQSMVVAGDVTLGRLSEFVRQFSRAGYGDSALLSAQHKVLARSDRPGVIHDLQPPEGILAAIQQHLRAGGDASAFLLDHAGERYRVRSSRIASTGWQLVSWVPEDRLLGDLRRAVLWSMALMLAFLGIILVVSLRLAKLVTTPVEDLSRIARRIGRLELDELPRVKSRVLEIQQLDQALDDSARGLKAFRKFVPVDVVTQLVDRGHALAPSGAARRITTMFTDVEGFTRISEVTPPDMLVAQLTRYFNLAAEIFARHGGTIDKFIGDGIMVLWGAPSELPDAELRACRAALELQAALDVLNAEWRGQGLHEFRTRIGLHSGIVIAGVLGSNDRLSYTAFGDTINVASRVEGMNKELGTRILMSETTWEGLRQRLPTRRIEAMELRGLQRRLVLYELLPPSQP